MKFRERFDLLPKPKTGGQWIYRPSRIVSGTDEIATIPNTINGIFDGDAIAALRDWIELADEAISMLESIKTMAPAVGTADCDSLHWIEADVETLTTGEHR